MSFRRSGGVGITSAGLAGVGAWAAFTGFVETMPERRAAWGGGVSLVAVITAIDADGNLHIALR